MNLKLITDLNTLLLSQRQWDEVAGDFPLFRHAWLISWLEHLGNANQPAVLVAVKQDPRTGQEHWLGIAPWCIESSGLTRKLSWLGSGTACTDYQNLIVGQENCAEFTSAVAAWLANNMGNGKAIGSIDALEMDGALATDSRTEELIVRLQTENFQFHAAEHEGCWKVDLPSSWDELNSQLSKSMRRKTKKAMQRLNDPASRVRSTLDTPLQALWPNFIELHQRRRIMLGQPGCFADPAFETFLLQAVERLIISGHADLIEISHEEKPLASMLLLNNGQDVYMYQSGMCDQRTASEPGYQMVTCALQRSIEQGYRSFDFLRGDEPYKSRWNSQRVPISRIKFVPRKLSAQLKHSIWLTGKSIKGYVGQMSTGNQ